MSSDSSVSSSSSRIRQFGLYRTIDARTEEFLRLSRKRQIRQGCACAAVSTAITVTVVVMMFLVYEFSINSEINVDNSIVSNWLKNLDKKNNEYMDQRLGNDINQPSINLLPVIIKSLKKNINSEKVTEASTLTSDSGRYTENFFSKKIYPSLWTRLPTPKIIAKEYKTPAVVYFQHPTERMKYITKIRKIREYQRIVNYFDKMISEKAYTGSTKPMRGKHSSFTDYPQKHRKPNKEEAPKQAIINVIPTKYNDDKKVVSCNCPKNIGGILTKILNNVQNMQPITNTENPKVSRHQVPEKPIVLKSPRMEMKTYKDFSDFDIKSYDFTTTSNNIEGTDVVDKEKTTTPMINLNERKKVSVISKLNKRYKLDNSKMIKIIDDNKSNEIYTTRKDVETKSLSPRIIFNNLFKKRNNRMKQNNKKIKDRDQNEAQDSHFLKNIENDLLHLAHETDVLLSNSTNTTYLENFEVNDTTNNDYDMTNIIDDEMVDTLLKDEHVTDNIDWEEINDEIVQTVKPHYKSAFLKFQRKTESEDPTEFDYTLSSNVLYDFPSE